MADQVIDFKFRVEVTAPCQCDAKSLSQQVIEALEALPVVSSVHELKWVRRKSGRVLVDEVQFGE